MRVSPPAARFNEAAANRGGIPICAHRPRLPLDRFNEAAANRGGILGEDVTYEHGHTCFNEAAANRGGIRAAPTRVGPQSRASMRPPRIAAEYAVDRRGIPS